MKHIPILEGILYTLVILLSFWDSKIEFIKFEKFSVAYLKFIYLASNNSLQLDDFPAKSSIYILNFLFFFLQSTSAQPLLGQTQFRNQHHQHAHHAHLHHHHQHPVQTNEQTMITYGQLTNTHQAAMSPSYNQNLNSSHSQISFGSNPPPPIQEGSGPMSNTHSSSPHAHSPPDPLSKTTIVHTPTTHSFADLPF